jgi:DNA-binding response OmpR family regulator
VKKILLVEDDFFIRDLYFTELKNADYVVDLAVDGKEGLDKIVSVTYDVILLDIMLPYVNGLEILRNIRTRGSRAYSTPVYILTNVGEEEILKESFSLGAEGYLIKSQIKPANLVQEINTFFAKHSK